MWSDFFVEFDAIDWGGVCVAVLLLSTVILLILYFTAKAIPLNILLLVCGVTIISAGFWAGFYYERYKKQKQPQQNLWYDPYVRVRERRKLQKQYPEASFDELTTMQTFPSISSRTPSQRSSIASTNSRRSSFEENENSQM